MIKVMGLIVPDQIFWSNQPILTSAQVAEFYGCSTDRIKDNYAANKDRFVEGKHFFKVEGEALKLFKRQVAPSDSPSLKFASCLHLWTKRGCARHAKLLKTDKAWEVFEALEDNYFNNKIEEKLPSIGPDKKLSLLMELIKITPDENQKVELIRQAAYILNQN